MTKIILLLAVIGHILCGVADCFLSYSKKGRMNFKNIKDSAKMSEMFSHMPLSFPLLSILIGTFAITLFAFGYFELSRWMKVFSKTASTIMYISTIVFLVPIVVHHVICGVVEYMYIRFGRTDDARKAVLDFQKKTACTMIVGYIGILVFMLTLFIMVVAGKTSMPRWGCVFNTIVMFLILLPTSFPAKGNIAGCTAFVGLMILI